MWKRVLARMFREKFPIFETKYFINSCSKGALSIEVQQAYQQYLQDWAEQGSPWELWVTQHEEFRGQVAKLLHADADEIAIKTSVSDAVIAIANSLDYSGERKKIIVDDYAFPTTAQIWHAQEKHGASVVHIHETDKATLPLEKYAEVIDEETLVVSLTHVCYRHGGKQDIAEIAKLAHEKGALVLLDSYQALGTFPIDVAELGVDFLVGGMLKYLLGSAGLAFLYVHDEHIQTLLPSVSGWFAQSDIFAMDIYQNNFASSARRFESGTPPNANVYAGIAGLKLVENIGIPQIERHIQTITSAIKDRARERNYTIRTPETHGAMIAIQSHDVEQLVGLLAENDNVIVSSRDGNLRISPHFYNDLSDVDALFAGLLKYEHLLVR